MDLSNFDTPMLRDEYRKFQKAGLELMGSGATPRAFNRLVEEEMRIRGAEPTSRNYVRFAAEVLINLSHEVAYDPETDSYDLEM